MKATLQAQVLGVKSINVDGNVYSSVFIGQQAEQGSATSKGVEVMKVSCDADVFASMPRETYPIECSLEMEFRQGGGGKMVQHVVKAVPVRSAKAS